MSTTRVTMMSKAAQKRMAGIKPEVVRKNSPAGLDAVYVGRPTKWGNPHSVGVCANCWLDGNGQRANHTLDEAIKLYEQHLDASPELLAALPELKGRDLSCWCAPNPCHADVLLRRANQ